MTESPLPPPSPRERARIVVVDGERTRLHGRQWVCLAALTVLAAALRLFGLGEWSLWVDEAHTWRDATMPLHGPNGFLASDRVLYPVTFLLLRQLIDLGWIGEDEASLRLPFVLVGTLTVPLLALVGRRFVGAWASVLAAGMLAVHPWHIYWSQNARGYVFVVFAAVLVVDRAFAYVRRDRLRDLGLVWVCIGFGTLCHPTGAGLAIAFLAFLLLRAMPWTPRRGLVFGLASAAVLLVGLPWALQNLSPYQGFLRAKSSPSLLHFVQTSAFYFRPIALLLAAVGVVGLHRFAGRDRALLLGCFLLAPFLVVAALGNAVVLATARYAIVALPALAWLAAFACVQLGEAAARHWRGRGLAAWLAAAALPLCVLGEQGIAVADYAFVQHGQRARWREAAAFLRQQAGGRPIRVATINYPTVTYYLRRGMWRGVMDPADLGNDVVPITDWMIAEGIDQQKNRIAEPGAAGHLAWHRQAAAAAGALFAVVVTLPELAEQDRNGSFLAAVRDACELGLHLPCWVGPKDESIYIYVLKQP